MGEYYAQAFLDLLRNYRNPVVSRNMALLLAEEKKRLFNMVDDYSANKKQKIENDYNVLAVIAEDLHSSSPDRRENARNQIAAILAHKDDDPK